MSKDKIPTTDGGRRSRYFKTSADNSYEDFKRLEGGAEIMKYILITIALVTVGAIAYLASMSDPGVIK